MMKTLKILTLDGGGSKGIYTLGILQEMQEKLGMPLVNYFDCFYGTSTGAIIAAMLVLGRDIAEIKDMYLHRVPYVMTKKTPALRTAELKRMLKEEFGDAKFEDCPRYLGVIASLVNERKPRVFRPVVNPVMEDRRSLFSGHGFTIAEALLSSCAAVPYFQQVNIKSSNGVKDLFLIDGGFMANNPTRCSIEDAKQVFNKNEEDLFVVNVGAGTFPRDLKVRHVLSVVNTSLLSWYAVDYVQLGLRKFFGKPEPLMTNERVLRVNEEFTHKSLKTNFLEEDVQKLEELYVRGRASFALFKDEFDYKRSYISN